MPEIIGTFLRAELRHEGSNCAVQAAYSSLGRLAQQCLELAVRHFDGIEVGRVFGQIAKARPRLLDGFADAGDLVGGIVVHHDDVVAPERRTQTLLDIGQEHVSSHGSLDHHRRDHLVVAQRGHKGDRLPRAQRDVADQSCAARRTPLEPGKIGADRRLVDKHQPRGIKPALLADPAATGAGYIGALPFRGLQAFF